MPPQCGLIYGRPPPGIGHHLHFHLELIWVIVQLWGILAGGGGGGHGGVRIPAACHFFEAAVIRWRPETTVESTYIISNQVITPILVIIKTSSNRVDLLNGSRCARNLDPPPLPFATQVQKYAKNREGLGEGYFAVHHITFVVQFFKKYLFIT